MCMYKLRTFRPMEQNTVAVSFVIMKLILMNIMMSFVKYNVSVILVIEKIKIKKNSFFF